MEIDVNMNKIDSVEKIIADVLKENDFNNMSNLINKKKADINKKFLFPNATGNKADVVVSVQKASLKPFTKIITEEEFYKIVGLTKRGLSVKSGKFQEHLYGNYLEALRLNDEGYISDVLEQALQFQTNLNYVKSLMKNKSFVKEWRKNFAEETAVEVYKRKGNLRIVNIIKERTK